MRRLNIATGAWAEAHTPIRGVEQSGTKRNNFTENLGAAPNKPAPISYKIKCSKVAHNCPHPSHIRPQLPLIRPQGSQSLQPPSLQVREHVGLHHVEPHDEPPPPSVRLIVPLDVVVAWRHAFV